MVQGELAYDAEKYRLAVEIYDALRATIPRFREKNAFMRVTEPITRRIRDEIDPSAGIVAGNRDRVVCALVNKGCNTHAAVRVLTDAGHGDDAMALSRVLLENAALLDWLLIDPIYRLELYAISDALYRRRWGDLIEMHFQSHPELVAQAKAEIDAQTLAVADFFGNTIHKWAQVLHPDGKAQHVNFEAMMKENASGGGSMSTFRHDVIYFLHSAFVHSTANSMRSFRRLKFERRFTCELGPNNAWCDQALGGANIFLFQILQSGAQYLGFADIESELDALFEQIRGEVLPPGSSS
jgi:hypothetical protein